MLLEDLEAGSRAICSAPGQQHSSCVWAAEGPLAPNQSPTSLRHVHGADPILCDKMSRLAIDPILKE